MSPNIHVDEKGEIATFRVEKALDGDAIRESAMVFDRLVDAGKRAFVLDLSACARVENSSFIPLLRMIQGLRRRHCCMAIVAEDVGIVSRLRAVGIHALVPICPDPRFAAKAIDEWAMFKEETTIAPDPEGETPITSPCVASYDVELEKDIVSNIESRIERSDSTVPLPGGREDMVKPEESFIAHAGNSFVAQCEVHIIRRIAAGGMGEVFEAKLLGPSGFSKVVALKTILPRYAQAEAFAKMFIGEARLAATLVHQNVVQIYQLGKLGAFYYLLMEYINGWSVRDFLLGHQALRRPVPIEIGTFIISRVCRGLEYAHNKTGPDGRLLGIVHRDVCPRNILMTSEGVVKIGDFGLAKARTLTEAPDKDVVIGKYPYMSPEMTRGEETDHRSDIFSLGVVFYELLTGRTPFEGADREEIMEKVRTEPPICPREIRPEIPPEVERIMLRALEKDPHDRYQSVGRMGYELEYYMYHDRFGPTNLTLDRYLKSLFPQAGGV